MSKDHVDPARWLAAGGGSGHYGTAGGPRHRCSPRPSRPGRHLRREALDLSRPWRRAALQRAHLRQEEGREVYWHSAAHVMAGGAAVFPEAKPTIGPPIADGFFYDFDVYRPFTDEDLERIEAEMHKLVKADLPFERQVVSRARRWNFSPQRVQVRGHRGVAADAEITSTAWATSPTYAVGHTCPLRAS